MLYSVNCVNIQIEYKYRRIGTDTAMYIINNITKDGKMKKHLKLRVINIEKVKGEFVELLDFQYTVTLRSDLLKNDIYVNLNDEQIKDYKLNSYVLRLVEGL